MSDDAKKVAPERIWMQLGGSYKAVGHVWKEKQSNPDESCVRYVRADLAYAQAEELRAEVERLRAAVKQAINLGTHDMAMDKLHSGSCSTAMALCMSILELALQKPAATEQEDDDA